MTRGDTRADTGDGMDQRERTTVDELLRRHAIDPAALDPAPADPDRGQLMARYADHAILPCTVCGLAEGLRTSRSVLFPGHGTRWVDLCREHSLQTMPAWPGPSSVDGIVRGLREAAPGVRLRVWTDEQGWQDEPHA